VSRFSVVAERLVLLCVRAGSLSFGLDFDRRVRCFDLEKSRCRIRREKGNDGQQQQQQEEREREKQTRPAKGDEWDSRERKKQKREGERSLLPPTSASEGLGAAAGRRAGSRQSIYQNNFNIHSSRLGKATFFFLIRSRLAPEASIFRLLSSFLSQDLQRFAGREGRVGRLLRRRTAQKHTPRRTPTCTHARSGAAS